MTILQIALPIPIRNYFDYLLPEPLHNTSLTPGIRIQVPFGKKILIGILVGIAQTTEIPTHKLKYVLDILDQHPVLSPSLLSLIQWASKYYHYPLGEVIKYCLPKKIREGRVIKPFNCIENTLSLLKKPHLTLNPEQALAFNEISKCNQFQTFLLNGITGSGKTEIYLQAIAQQLEAGKQALVLVPEIALTPQTITRFEERFTCKIVSHHSKVTDSEKWQVWQAISSGQAGIIIGTRSAIFSPLKNPGIIIVDEEHDASFKQQTRFRYSARDLAIIRGQIDNIPVILGSATPSLESFYNVQLNKFKHLELTQRTNQTLSPVFYLIDIKNQSLMAGLSQPLLNAIEKHLNQNNQVLIFLNRRGFSPLLLCHRCGWTAQCHYCDAKMVWHHLPQRLFCHHCNFNQPKPTHCASCNHTEILMLGMGTEKLEQTLTSYFKNHTVARIDKDSTRSKGSIENFLKKIHAGEIQLLIGTQMLAKGHHFPNLTMVAILEADSGLYSADFKACERLGQLILQVAGRAGRGEKPGEVYIQTHHPTHPWLQTLIQQNYQTFAKQLMKDRKAAQLPPYYYMAMIRAEAKTLDKALSFLKKIKLKLNMFENRLSISPPPSCLDGKKIKYI